MPELPEDTLSTPESARRPRALMTRTGKAAVRVLKGTNALLDAAELGLVALAVAAAAVAGVIGLPVYLIWHLSRSGHLVAAALLLGAVCLLAVNVVRDVKRREFGWVSATVAAVLTVWCAYVAVFVIA